MAKSITVKFPRVHAGFYGVTLDGEHVGYVMCEKDGKETNWYIFDNATPGLDIAELSPDQSIDTPDSLFREAKESAKAYFLNRPVTEDEGIENMSLPEAEWEDSTIITEVDENGDEFEPVFDELEPELEPELVQA